MFVDQNVNPIEVLMEAGLTGTQSYFTPEEGLAGSAPSSGPKAIGGCLLPANAKFIMALPMSLFDDPASQIESMVGGLARSKAERPEFPVPEGIFDTFLLDSGSGDNLVERDRRSTGTRRGTISESMRQNGMKLIVAGGLNS